MSVWGDDQKTTIDINTVLSHVEFVGTFLIKSTDDIIKQLIVVDEHIIQEMNTYIILDGKQYHWGDVDLLDAEDCKSKYDVDIDKINSKIDYLSDITRGRPMRPEFNEELAELRNRINLMEIREEYKTPYERYMLPETLDKKETDFAPIILSGLALVFSLISLYATFH